MKFGQQLPDNKSQRLFCPFSKGHFPKYRWCWPWGEFFVPITHPKGNQGKWLVAECLYLFHLLFQQFTVMVVHWLNEKAICTCIVKQDAFSPGNDCFSLVHLCIIKKE